MNFGKFLRTPFLTELLWWLLLYFAVIPSYIEYPLLFEGQLIKACVRYFLSESYFSLNDSPSKTMKNVFHFI